MPLIALKQLTKHYSAADNYVMSLEAVCVQRLFADGKMKLTVAEQKRKVVAIKLLNFVACLTWA